MGTYTGTDEDDTIRPGFISDAAVADPPGTTPGDDSDTLIGNGGDDTLNGGGSDDQLFGGAGKDRLRGGDGNDQLFGGAGKDRLAGQHGNDQIFGGASDEYLSGGRDDDQLLGGKGSDFLVGGAGADIMKGGAGDDLYFAKDQGDVVVEDTAGSSGGVDTVIVDFSYTLGFGLDNLSLSGVSKDLDGTGNALDNELVATDGDNVLRGHRGDDRLLGFEGNDRLRGGQGKDELDGGQGRDLLRGGQGKDELWGGKGKAQDQLNGGGGDDAFLFLRPEQGGDTITDFGNTSGNNDRFVIDAFWFGDFRLEAGRLSRERFQTSAGHEAQDRDIRCIFDTTNETLWFDANGSKNGGLTLVADLQAGAEVTHNDIFLVLNTSLI